jgi:hypothetical protein
MRAGERKTGWTIRSELPENWTSARARASACRAGFAIPTAVVSTRLGQCGKPCYQSRFEPMTGTLETFVTLAAIWPRHQAARQDVAFESGSDS